MDFEVILKDECQRNSLGKLSLYVGLHEEKLIFRGLFAKTLNFRISSLKTINNQLKCKDQNAI